MKILITGVTARMIGSKRLKYDYLSNVSIIEKALKMAGHEVETRKVSVKESLKDYDVALVGMAPIFSLGAGYYPEACHVLDQMGSRALLYADDWSFVAFGDTVRGALKGWGKYLAWRKFEQDEKRMIEPKHIKRMEKILKEIVSNQCPWKTLVPMFGWAKPEPFMEGIISSEAIPFDPTPLYEMPLFTANGNKKKQWVSAALGDHDGWLKKLGLEWPVVQLGNKRKGQPVLAEKDVIQMYAHNWGVLAAKYPKAGTGWWRVRFIHALRTGAVMLCDPEEGRPIGDSFCIPPDLLEKLDDSGLRQISKQQGAELSQWLWPAHKTVNCIQQAVNRAWAREL